MLYDLSVMVQSFYRNGNRQADQNHSCSDAVGHRADLRVRMRNMFCGDFYYRIRKDNIWSKAHVYILSHLQTEG